MRKLFICLFFILLFIAPSAQASENFSRSYDTVYTVLDDGTTKVEYTITLKNKSSSIYAPSYALDIGFPDMYNIHVSDSKGAIKPEITTIANGRHIRITFNKGAVGIGKEIKFKVSFYTRTIVQKQGDVWEIDIPALSNQKDLDAFTVRVTFPKDFGTPTYVKPQPKHKEYTFTKEDVGTGGVSISFGDKQIYEFTLTYHIQNKNVLPNDTEITIPATTNYQEVAIESIKPLPTTVREDGDGNWLAVYQMLPAEKKKITVKGIAVVSLFPARQPLTEEELQPYLKPQPFWDIEDLNIQKKARELKTAKNIYTYVVKTLTYDFARVTEEKPRLGAAQTFLNPTSAVCLEFTDLFIALARAAGIPAREVNGFAYTQNIIQKPIAQAKDILHAWPEYYDTKSKRWIMVDPTWGNTTGGLDYFKTFDFDHVSFIKRGISSTQPIPPGGYKSDVLEKNISVSFSKKSLPNEIQVELKKNIPKEGWAGMPINGTITIKNASKILLPKQDVVVTANNLSPKNQTITFVNVPPYGQKTLPIYFNSRSFLTKSMATVTIQFENKKIPQTILITPIFEDRNAQIIGGSISVIFIIIVSFTAARTGHIPFFRHKR